jgi:hypothetical protein
MATIEDEPTILNYFGVTIIISSLKELEVLEKMRDIPKVRIGAKEHDLVFRFEKGVEFFSLGGLAQSGIRINTITFRDCVTLKGLPTELDLFGAQRIVAQNCPNLEFIPGWVINH